MQALAHFASVATEAERYVALDPQRESDGQAVVHVEPHLSATPEAARVGREGFSHALELVLSSTAMDEADPRSGDRARFQREANPVAALQILLGDLQGLDRQTILSVLNLCIAEIDQVVSRQLDQVLHHPQFQELEAAWRGLAYLVEQRDRFGGENERVQIRFLDISWNELKRDLDSALEFDQSHVFKSVYSAEFDMPGGTPYGMLIGNYAIRPHPEDYLAIEQMSGVAAAAFCPFITGVSPEFLGVEDFSELESVRNLGGIFEGKEYIQWRALRETEDARYVGLAMPRVLMRLPYEDDGSQTHGFRYRETVGGRDRNRYLWGNAAFAFGEVLIRSFGESSWLANIRGVTRNEESGGLVTGLPVHSFGTDRLGIAPSLARR